MKNNYFFLFIITLFSCNNKTMKENDTISLIKEKTNIVWEDTGIILEDSISVIDNSLYFDLKFIDDYFLLDETKDVLFSYLFYSLDTLIHKYDTIYITQSYIDLIDINKYSYTKNDVLRKQLKFEQNPLFKDLCIYSLMNLNTNEIIVFHEIIKDINFHVYSDQKEKVPLFWELLYKYTQKCCNKHSIERISMLIIFDVVTEKVDNRKDVIQYIIDTCEKQCEDISFKD